MQITLTELHKRLLNDFQRDFPLMPSPYRALAEHLGVHEAAVLAAFAELDRQQLVSRIGAIIPPNHIGASTLVAMAIPPGQLQAVADRISAFPEVNHNYERENRFNLWFVAAASSAGQLQTVLAAIEQATGFAALRLPLVDDFFIDLGFPLDFCQSGNTHLRWAYQIPQWLDKLSTNLIRRIWHYWRKLLMVCPCVPGLMRNSVSKSAWTRRRLSTV